MGEQHITKLIDYLSHFGRVRFRRYESNGENTDFACIELTTTEEIAGNLEKELNSQLKIEAGAMAHLRFIGLSEIEEKKRGKGIYRYAAEIVPYNHIQRNQWEEATEDTLKKLPHIIRNFRLKNLSRVK